LGNAIICKACDGTGFDPDQESSYKLCEECGGEGFIQLDV